MPTITVTLQTSLPARMNNVAIPAWPVTIVSLATCSPAATGPAVAVAISGFVLVIDTSVDADAGAESTAMSTVLV